MSKDDKIVFTVGGVGCLIVMLIPIAMIGGVAFTIAAAVKWALS